MSFTSLELNQQAGADALGADVLELLKNFVRGLESHATPGDTEDLIALRRRLLECSDSLNLPKPPQTLLVSVRSILDTLDTYTRRSVGVVKEEANELRGLLAAMTSAMKAVTSSSETSVKQLTLMESQLKQATTLDDLRRVKLYASSCLTMVRRETGRLQAEAVAQAETLKELTERFPSGVDAILDSSKDSVTGLPNRIAAEQEIKKLLATGRPFVAALFVIERLATLNTRFGHTVGDDIIRANAQMLSQKLQQAAFYRWSGPAFVAIFDSSVSADLAEGRATAAAAQRLERNLTTDHREIMIIVATSCYVLRVSPNMTPEDVSKTVDGFLAG